MRRISLVVATMLILGSFCGCKNTQKAAKTDAVSQPTDVTNAQNSLDWVGFYFGTVPCADCPGIDVQITLNSDLTYTMRRVYQDRKGSFTNAGSFVWNATKTAITLKNVNEGGAFEHFAVKEGKLIMQSVDGKKLPDEKQNTLSKHTESVQNELLTSTYWKLVELNGKPITSPKEPNNEAHILFNPNGRVSGSLGCNTFTGSYTLQENSRIQFSQMVNTKKMCLDMSVEEELVKILQVADSYAITDNQLTLNRARMAPLAKFEAVYMR
ncbi:MAG: META domain-containing protein [Bacteroidales bacterium]|jgi:heat shock protein HslJ/uncharacterized lipoprotein NlpE involved in copper resistance|nr:META domain-containing protein [Bacteroidales bacterium]